MDVTKWTFEEFHMPPLWNNEDFIYEYMQAFKRPRHIDPVTYDKKLQFWRQLIMSYASHYHIVALTETSLANVFTKTFSDHSKEKPQCLNTVFADMLRTGEVVASDDRGALGKIMSSTFDYFVKRPLSWSWSKVTGDSQTSVPVNPSSNVPQEKLLILPDSVERHAKEFIQIIRERIPLRLTHRIPVMPVESFDSLCEHYFPHELSRSYMRQYLINRGLISQQQVSQGKSTSFTVIKFSEKDSVATSVGDISAEEGNVMAGILYLRQVIHTLEVEEVYLVDKIAQRHEQIRSLMKNNKKEDAKQLLRRTKLVEKAVEEKRSQLQNLEGMLLQVESASNNRQVMSALSLAGKTLRSTAAHAETELSGGTRKSGLTLAETMEDALAEIADSISQQKEIIDTLSGPAADETELAELEDELEDLLKVKEKESSSQAKVSGPSRMFKKSEQERSFDEALLNLDLSDIQLPDVSQLPPPSLSPQKETA